MSFFFAAQKPFARNSVMSNLFYDRFDRCLACPRAAGQILHQNSIEDPDFEAQTCTRIHGLTLVVGR